MANTNTDFLKYATKIIEASKKNAEYKTNPVLWAKEVLDFHMWSKQAQVAMAVVKYKKVAVSSCHGSGKSALAAVLVCWWACTRINDDAISMVTAPTFSQMHAVVFESIRKLHAKFELPGKVTLDDFWKTESGEIIALGRKPSDQNESAFQGIHRTGGVFVVIDEAVGVHENIFIGAEAVTTGRLDHIYAPHNPDDISSYIGRAWLRKDPSWHFINISAFETPNFTGEWVPDVARNGLISPEWVEEKKISWGEDSPRYKSKILGEFSEESGHNLFTVGTLLKAQTTELTIGQESTPILGVDVARMGEDYSVVYSYQDGVLRFVDKWNKTGAMETAQKIVDIAWDLGAKEVRIDGVGLGGPVIDIVNSKSDARFTTVGILGNGASPDTDKWFNYRAFMYDDIRERMANGLIDTDIEDTELFEELSGLEYHFKNPRNSLQIEKKEDIRTRTGKSPDFADAAAYACATIGIDPSSPEAKLKIGETYQMDLESLLWDSERIISPF